MLLPLLPLLPLLSLLTPALSAPFPTARTPLLAFSHPLPFLGLDDPNTFTNPQIGHVAFIPGFHACGVLNVWAVEPALEGGDWDLLAQRAANSTEGEGERDEGVWQRWERAPSRVREAEAVEGVILAWAEGWKKTCGKKGANGRRAEGEVRVAKVFVDGPADPRGYRDGWVGELDDHLRPLIAALPPASSSSSEGTNSVVFLTSLSAPTLLKLFDLASSPSPSPSPPSTPPPTTVPARKRRSHSFFARITGLMFDLLLLAALLLGAHKALLKFKAWRASRSSSEDGGFLSGGGIRLPVGLSAQEEREFQFELEGASEDEDDHEGAEELPYVVDVPLVQKGGR
ncbi:hypothetical protein JCM6882_002966 [Rhodosporidiobolus microsporus]